MYVLHFPIFLWLQTHSAVYDRTFGRWSPLAFVATMMILAYCAAFVSYHLLEKPFLSLKRFFVPQYGDAMPSGVPSAA
jgi:peptidoglycan/LPS O-acetylase OafA/YrhL